MGLITAKAWNLLPCVKDGGDSECALEEDVGSLLNGLCGKNGEDGCVLPEREHMEGGGCHDAPTERAA